MCKTVGIWQEAQLASGENTSKIQVLAQQRPLKTVRAAVQVSVPAGLGWLSADCMLISGLNSYLYTGIISITEMGIKLWPLDHDALLDYGVRSAMQPSEHCRAIT